MFTNLASGSMSEKALGIPSSIGKYWEYQAKSGSTGNTKLNREVLGIPS